MLVRVDHAYLSRQKMENVTTAALAYSDDGIAWEVRLMRVEGHVYVTVAVNTQHGMETWCVSTDDFERFEPFFKMAPAIGMW